MLAARLFLYRLFTSDAGKRSLKLFRFGVQIDKRGLEGFGKEEKQNAGKEKNKRKRYSPFLIAITIDTEGGYVENNQRRVWQKESPHSFQGYHFGLKNLLDLFKKEKIRSTFFLNTHCFSAKGEEYKQILEQLSRTDKEEHEIGLHPHFDSDEALKKKMGRDYPATSCYFYDKTQLTDGIKGMREILRDHLGAKREGKIKSARWGNWALNGDGVVALESNRISIDSSATPGIFGHLLDSRKYDWRRVFWNVPWMLDKSDHQRREGNSKIVEIPIATFSFFGKKLRADPLYSVLLQEAFLRYYDATLRSERPFPFVVITHSTEATMNDGSKTRMMDDLSEFIRFAKKFDGVEFVSISEAARRYGTVK